MFLCAVAAVLTFGWPPAPATPAAAAGPGNGGFVANPIFSGFDGFENPTAVEFAPNGRVFVAEQRGTIQTFDDIYDPTPTQTVDLTSAIYKYWDRGLLGMAVDPDFPAEPYLYVLYALDTGEAWPTLDGSAPDPPTPWNDSCPDPPGATDDGCVADGRLSRFPVDSSGVIAGAEQVLLEGYWCQQYPSHAPADLAFGPDGALYVSAGDGASFSWVDYGQGGGDDEAGNRTPVNPCADPDPTPGADGTPTLPDAEGGALRSQDVVTPGDPITYSGAVLRIDPDTGDAIANPNHPFYADTGAPEARIVAHGLRNPYRFTVRPGVAHTELWIGDVGWGAWEEVNRVLDTADGVIENFGWPCFEGNGRNPGYNGADIDLCEGLYAGSLASPTTLTGPYYTYRHGAGNAPDTTACERSGAAITGLDFYTGTTYPAAFDGALFFGDYSHRCVWAMQLGAGVDPDPSQISTVLSDVAVVEVEAGPGGEIYVVERNLGLVYRLGYPAGNSQPSAVIESSARSGAVPLTVELDASGSTDPDADHLRYAWDLDGDGLYGADDSPAEPTTPRTSASFVTAGSYTVGLRVTDFYGGTDTDSAVIIAAGPPVAVGDGPYTVVEGAQLVATAGSDGVLENDSDAAGRPLTSVLETDVAHGALTLQGDGSFTYVHDGGETTADSFTYRAWAGGSASNLATVAINIVPANDPPNMEPVGDRVVTEQQLLAFDVSANDPDLPGDQLTFSLQAAPAGAVIDAVSGRVTWIPSEEDGPGSHGFTVRVTDDGVPSLFDQRSLTVTVMEVNGPPSVQNPGSQADAEGSTVSLPVDAGDPDIPANSLTYSATGLPEGLAIDPTSGEISGSIGFEAAAGSPYSVAVTVRDDGSPPMSATAAFEWFVANTNRPPDLDPIDPQATDEGEALIFFVAAEDLDRETITFSLEPAGTPVPDGATIDPATGEFRWTPAESHGPGLYAMFVRASDNGTPSLFDQRLLTVQVNEVNAPPVIQAPADPSPTIPEGDEWSHPAVASDPDIPANPLVFSVDGAPSGVAIDSGSGAVTWTPGEVQGPGTYAFDVVVTDAGGLTDRYTLNVQVDEVNAPPLLQAPADTSPSILEGVAWTHTARATDADIPADTLVFSVEDAPAGVAVDSGTGVVTWIPAEDQGPGTYVFDVVVTDAGGLTDRYTLSVQVNESNARPTATILSPASGFTWDAGETIDLLGSASDVDVPLQTFDYQWTVTLWHCPDWDCHEHEVSEFSGASSSISGPDHEYPSYLEITLTVTDQFGASDTVSRIVHPNTVVLTFATDPAGVGLFDPTPYSLEVIVASHNTVSAPQVKAYNGTNWSFDGWSDGGARTHLAMAPAAPTTYTASYTSSPPEPTDDTYVVIEGRTLAVDGAILDGVLANDGDVDGDVLTAMLVDPPAGGSLSFSPDGTFTYRHDGSEQATQQFTYVVSDGLNTSRLATATIVIARTTELCSMLTPTIEGDDGDDVLIGTDGDDVIFGHGGNDEIRGGGGDDVICGGAGDDILIGGAGADHLFGKEGDDLVKGTAGDDVLLGGGGADRLQGNAGDDELDGGDGNDRMWGGIGNDALEGGAGNDQLHGNAGSDTLVGGDGTDRVWGDADDDRLEGNANSDFLYGGIGSDVLIGGQGNDRLFGHLGDDELYGDRGIDKLRGQGGDDLVDGGPHTDWCSDETTWLNCERML